MYKMNTYYNKCIVHYLFVLINTNFMEPSDNKK